MRVVVGCAEEKQMRALALERIEPLPVLREGRGRVLRVAAREEGQLTACADLGARGFQLPRYVTCSGERLPCRLVIARAGEQRSQREARHGLYLRRGAARKGSHEVLLALWSRSCVAKHPALERKTFTQVDRRASLARPVPGLAAERDRPFVGRLRDRLLVPRLHDVAVELDVGEGGLAVVLGSVLDPEGEQVVGQVGGPDDVVTSSTYTPAGLLDTLTDPRGFVTDFDYEG